MAKNHKNFTDVKIGKYDEEAQYLKKSFLLKRHLYLNGKAQIIPVVAGRLVILLMAA